MGDCDRKCEICGARFACDGPTWPKQYKVWFTYEELAAIKNVFYNRSKSNAIQSQSKKDLAYDIYRRAEEVLTEEVVDQVKAKYGDDVL